MEMRINTDIEKYVVEQIIRYQNNDRPLLTALTDLIKFGLSIKINLAIC